MTVMMNSLLVASILLTVTLFSATSTSQLVPGKNCVVSDEHGINVFNFTRLSESSDDHVIEHDTGEKVRLQLCSALRTKCDGKEGYSICLYKNNTEIGIGRKNPRLENDSGRLQFNFTGDNCEIEPGKNYTVNILMKCDYSAENNSHLYILYHEKDACDLHMYWRTKYACIPEEKKDCTAIDESGKRYDLSSLTKLSDNYEIRKNNNTAIIIIINVCHNVISEYNALCHKSSGVCLKNATDSSNVEFKNLGDVASPSIVEDGILKIEYPMGVVCSDNNSKAPHHWSTISFYCDPEATDTVPVYLDSNDPCHHQFSWNTSAACSEEILKEHAVANAGKCKVTNPGSKFEYNLKSLMNQDFSAALHGTQYKFRICGPVVDGICKPGTGVCITKNETSLGEANTSLMWNQSGPFLNYTDGDVCNNGQKRYTHIAFVCAAVGVTSGPVITADQECFLAVDWYTELVCEKKVRCSTPNGEVNLAPLIRSTENYVVKVHEDEFHINVCRPLIDTHGLTCAYGSAVCNVTRNAKGAGTSLGFPEMDLVLEKNGSAVLHYLGGSQCPENPEKNMSSIFTFYCDDNTNELPQFWKYEDCIYFFKWKTSRICGSLVGQWSPPCAVKNPMLSHELDLSALHEKPVHHVSSEHGVMYNVSICGNAEECKGSVICRDNISYGTLPNVNFEYSRNMINLSFSDGAKCNNRHYTSELRLICNTSGIGEPKLLSEPDNCSVIFEWPSSVACIQQPKEGGSSVNADSETYTEPTIKHTVDHVGLAFGILLLIGILAGVVFYLSSPVKRAHLHSCIRNLIPKRNNSRVQYSRVNTTEEARLLLETSDPAHYQTDSDDELLGA